MPRSPSTNLYTLPFSSFTTGQPILSAQFTGITPPGNFTDIAIVLSATVPTTPAAGQALMLAPLPLATGTQALPSLIMATDQSTGFYRISANIWGFSSAGTLAVMFAPTGVTYGIPVTFTSAVTVNATAVFAGPIAVGTSAIPKFDCRLTAPVGTNVTPQLSQYNGNLLFINGVNYVVPSAGVNLPLAGLAANTFYLVYAYMVGAVMTLEAVHTTYQVDPTYGHFRKTSDPLAPLSASLEPMAAAKYPTLMVLCSWRATSTGRKPLVGLISLLIVQLLPAADRVGRRHGLK